MKSNTIRPFTIVLGALLIALISSPSFAKNNHQSSTTWAKVKRVEPITRMIEQRIPEENCWYEDVEVDAYHSGSSSHTSTILGGIIGGAVGNAVGHKKKNKRIGTAVGALLGASIGSDIGHRHQPRHPVTKYRTEHRCEITDNLSYKEKVVGYDVWYRYRGETYKTRMDHNPGKRIKVRVIVKPI